MPTNSLKNFSISLTNDLMSTLTFSTAFERPQKHISFLKSKHGNRSHTHFINSLSTLAYLTTTTTKNIKAYFMTQTKCIYWWKELSDTHYHTIFSFRCTKSNTKMNFIPKHCINSIYITIKQNLVSQLPIILTFDDMTEQIKIL